MTQKKKPKVYITRRLPEVVETRMRELFDAELNIDDTPRSQPELVAAVKSADVLVPTLTESMKGAVVEGAVTGGGLTVIANAPNPAGQALLGRFFDGAISPAGLAAGALLPTIIAGLAFWLR